MTQLSSRGLRNAPVKNTRSMCTDDSRDEQQGRPVVDLAHEQAAADIEGDVQGGAEAADISTFFSGVYEPA